MKKIVFTFLLAFTASAFAQYNYVNIPQVPAGVNPPSDQRSRIEAVGPDPTIYIDYFCKGPGCAHVWRGQGTAHAFVAYAQHADGANFLEAHGSKYTPELRATGPGTDVSLLLRPQAGGVVKVKGLVEFVDISPGGVVTTLGFIGPHKALFGGTSNDLAIRVEAGNAIRFFVGGEEKHTIN